MHPQTSDAIFGASAHTLWHHQHEKKCHLVIGHTLIYILSKFEVNPTDRS